MSDIRYLRKLIGGVPVVTAPREIDITTADQLRAVLLDTATRGHAMVVVDLTLTRFCDSYGLHTLLRAHELAQADGGELRLVTPADAAVPRIFTLTCLDRLIPCFASLKEALPQMPAAMRTRRYQIIVSGRLGAVGREAFRDFQIEPHGTDTALTGDVNRSGLHDVLVRIRDLGLELVGVTCLAPS